MIVTGKGHGATTVSARGRERITGRGGTLWQTATDMRIQQMLQAAAPPPKGWNCLQYPFTICNHLCLFKRGDKLFNSILAISFYIGGHLCCHIYTLSVGAISANF